MCRVKISIQLYYICITPGDKVEHKVLSSTNRLFLIHYQSNNFGIIEKNRVILGKVSNHNFLWKTINFIYKHSINIFLRTSPASNENIREKLFRSLLLEGYYGFLLSSDRSYLLIMTFFQQLIN